MRAQTNPAIVSVMEVTATPKPPTTPEDAICRWLEDHGTRQSWLASKLEMSEMSLSRLLHRKNVRPISVEQLTLIAGILDVPRATEYAWLELLLDQEDQEGNTK